MKAVKYFMAAALALLALGCNKEQVAVDGTPDGQEVTVTFTAGLPGTPATKAIGDGTTAKNLEVAVYEDNGGAAGNYLKALDQTATFTDLKTTVNFSLVKGKTYHFIFWAQATGAPYTFDKDNKEIEISYAGDANDETRDAFYAVKTVKVTGAMTEPVELHRPFAQVNFGTADYDAAVAAGILPAKSVVVATDVATVFDPFAGEGKNPTTATTTVSTGFTAAALPTNPETLTVENVDYKYLAMNYIIPTGLLSEKHVTNLTATFTDANKQDVVVSVPSAPVQANWRTNIVGNLLTDQVVFNVEIKPAFEDDNNIDLQNISTTAALKALFMNGGSAVLADNIEISEPLEMGGNTAVTIDLNGHDIINKTPVLVGSDYDAGVFIVKNHATLTINGNGNVKSISEEPNLKPLYCMAIWAYDDAVVNINGGSFYNKMVRDGDGQLDLIYADDNAVINIYGGKFESANHDSNAYWVLNLKDGSNAKINVYGGEFVNFNPAASNTEPNGGANFCAPGYVSSLISGNPVIYKVAEAPTFVVKTAAELKTMLTTLTSAGAGNNIVEITDDIQFAAGETWTPVTVDGYHGAGVITVKGNGHTIKGLDAPLFAGGFAGKSGIAVHDLTLDSTKINDSANNQGLGAFVGSIDSMEKIELVNCRLVNSEIISTGGARVGGLIGWTSGYDDPNNGPVDTYITIKNCSVENCQITAKGSVGAIIGHAGANPATYHTIEGNTVKNCTLHSTDDGGWRVGVVVGTANVGEVTINNTTESGNTLTQDGKTAPAGQSNLYGRFVSGKTGKLTIDGIAVTL